MPALLLGGGLLWRPSFGINFESQLAKWPFPGVVVEFLTPETFIIAFFMTSSIFSPLIYCPNWHWGLGGIRTPDLWPFQPKSEMGLGHPETLIPPMSGYGHLFLAFFVLLAHLLMKRNSQINSILVVGLFFYRFTHAQIYIGLQISISCSSHLSNLSFVYVFPSFILRTS